MKQDDIQSQADRIDCLLPKILRQICTLDPPRTDLPIAQLRLCTILMGGPLTMSAVSREMGTTVSATTQLADRLEAIGFVERVTEPGDRRSRSLRLTPHGTDVMNESRERRLQRWTQLLRHLPAATRKRLIEILDEVVRASRNAFSDGDCAQDALAGRAAEILLQVERSDR